MKKDGLKLSNLSPLGMLRWLLCCLAFIILILLAWKYISPNIFYDHSWRPWVSWLLTFMGAEIYNARFEYDKNQVEED